MNRLTKDQLTAKAREMNLILLKESASEPNDLIDRIEKLSALISESGECLADAKYILDSLVHSEIMKAIKEGYNETLSATTLNQFIKALAKEENYLVNSFDRINSAAVHQLDGCRSILSYRKTEFATLSYQR